MCGVVYCSGTMPDLVLEDHAVKNMFDHGVSVTLNTGRFACLTLVFLSETDLSLS